MDTNERKKIEINGKQFDSLQDATAEMREAFRSAMAAWRSSNSSPRPPARPASIAGTTQGNAPAPFASMPGPAPIPVRPRATAPINSPQFSGTPASGRPFFIRALTWIAFWTIVVLLLRLIR